MDQTLNEVTYGNFGTNYVINNNIIENPSTTQLSIVDKEGNAISMTSSIEYFFGSAITASYCASAFGSMPVPSDSRCAQNRSTIAAIWSASATSRITT